MSTPFRLRLALQAFVKHNQIGTENAQGSTLMDLLLAIVVLGVLGGVGYGAYGSQVARSNSNIVAVAASAAAKNRAALLTTAGESAFEPAVYGTGVTITYQHPKCATDSR